MGIHLKLGPESQTEIAVPFSPYPGEEEEQFTGGLRVVPPRGPRTGRPEGLGGRHGSDREEGAGRLESSEREPVRTRK